MQLYMVELPVRDLAASMAWYRDYLKMRVVRLDDANGFALLEATSRLALKQSSAVAENVTLHFQVDSLDTVLQQFAEQNFALDSPPKSSDEGYRRVFVRDPDGHRVGFFEWRQAT